MAVAAPHVMKPSFLGSLRILPMLALAAVLASGALQAACAPAESVDQGSTESDLTGGNGYGYGHGYGYGYGYGYGHGR